MNQNEKMLTREEMLDYFNEINDQLTSQGVYGEIVLAGGAALTLVFNAILKPPQNSNKKRRIFVARCKTASAQCAQRHISD